MSGHPPQAPTVASDPTCSALTWASTCQTTRSVMPWIGSVGRSCFHKSDMEHGDSVDVYVEVPSHGPCAVTRGQPSPRHFTFSCCQVENHIVPVLVSLTLLLSPKLTPVLITHIVVTACCARTRVTCARDCLALLQRHSKTRSKRFDKQLGPGCSCVNTLCWFV